MKRILILICVLFSGCTTTRTDMAILNERLNVLQRKADTLETTINMYKKDIDNNFMVKIYPDSYLRKWFDNDFKKSQYTYIATNKIIEEFLRSFNLSVDFDSNNEIYFHQTKRRIGINDLCDGVTRAHDLEQKKNKGYKCKNCDLFYYNGLWE